MKQVIAFQTLDGTLHATHAQALKHAQKAYDARMTDLHHALRHDLDSHRHATKALDWIERNYQRIADARELAEDAKTLEKLDTDD